MKRQRRRTEKATKETSVITLPLVVIFAHIAPFAIRSFKDALSWMLTCKAGLKAANENVTFWEPFLLKLILGNVKKMREEELNELADLIAQRYVMWSPQMLKFTKRTGLLQVVKSKLVESFGSYDWQAMEEVLVDKDGTVLANVNYDAQFSSIEQINEVDATFCLSLGKAEMEGKRSSLKHHWHRVGLCTVKCNGLEFTGEFRHDPHPERRQTKSAARRFSRDDASIGSGTLFVNGKYYEKVTTRNMDGQDDKAADGMLFLWMAVATLCTLNLVKSISNENEWSCGTSSSAASSNT